MKVEEIQTASGTYEETLTLNGLMLNTNCVFGVYYDDNRKWVEIAPEYYSVTSTNTISFVEYTPPAGRIKIVYEGDETSAIVTALSSLSESALDAGTATGGSTTTLEDTTKDWDTNIFKYAMLEITGGTGEGQHRQIASNTSDTLTVSNAFTTAPDATSKYKIYGTLMGNLALENGGNLETIANCENGSNQLDMNIAASDIMVPVDVQAMLKTSLGSTTTALSASGTWTGSTFDASNYTKIVGYAYSDKSGTAYVEQSMDGTNWDVSESFSVTGGTTKVITATVVAKYVRIKYVNGTDAQATFRYQCFLQVM